jgi:hypothetical protein
MEEHGRLNQNRVVMARAELVSVHEEFNDG